MTTRVNCRWYALANTVKTPDPSLPSSIAYGRRHAYSLTSRKQPSTKTEISYTFIKVINFGTQEERWLVDGELACCSDCGVPNTGPERESNRSTATETSTITCRTTTVIWEGDGRPGTKTTTLRDIRGIAAT
jgi:hypothetical protein